MAEKAEMDTVKTSRLKSSNNFSRKAGFTLLEVMIVLGILGAMLAFGMPRLQGPKNNVKTVARKMATLSREIRHQARIKKMTYRLVLSMGESNSNQAHKYWVESAPANTLIPSQQTLESLAKLSDEERPQAQFQPVEKLVKGQRELPPGLFFGSVETQSDQAPITSGEAYIYYSAEGLVEQALVQITNRDKLFWTLVFNPLTGHVEIVERALQLKDMQVD